MGMMELMALQPPVAEALMLGAREGDSSITATVHALGDRMSVGVFAIDASGSRVSVIDRMHRFELLTRPLMELMDRHRKASYVDGAGTWFVGVFRLVVGGGLEVETDFESAPVTGTYPVVKMEDGLRELDLFPRIESRTPLWLAEVAVQGGN